MTLHPFSGGVYRKWLLETEDPQPHRRILYYSSYIHIHIILEREKLDYIYNFASRLLDIHSWNLILEYLKTQNFRPHKDHQCGVNLWNIGIWHNDSYNSAWELINQIYVDFEQLIVSIIYSVQVVQDNLTQISIHPKGWTIEIILKDIIIQHFCGLHFLLKCWAKWGTREFKLLSLFTFWDTFWRGHNIACKRVVSGTNVEIVATFSHYFVYTNSNFTVYHQPFPTIR